MNRSLRLRTLGRRLAGREGLSASPGRSGRSSRPAQRYPSERAASPVAATGCFTVARVVDPVIGDEVAVLVVVGARPQILVGARPQRGAGGHMRPADREGHRIVGGWTPRIHRRRYRRLPRKLLLTRTDERLQRRHHRVEVGGDTTLVV